MSLSFIIIPYPPIIFFSWTDLCGTSHSILSCLHSTVYKHIFLNFVHLTLISLWGRRCRIGVGSEETDVGLCKEKRLSPWDRVGHKYKRGMTGQYLALGEATRRWWDWGAKDTTGQDCRHPRLTHSHSPWGDQSSPWRSHCSNNLQNSNITVVSNHHTLKFLVWSSNKRDRQLHTGKSNITIHVHMLTILVDGL